MALFTVGSVPYVNAVPLIALFERMGMDSPVAVRYDVPSRLPAMLASGEVQAILVSSIDALRNPGRQMADGVCIGSANAVRSVRLFSKVPFDEVATLALDASSMTSNRLAQIVLSEVYGATPEARPWPSELDVMLEHADAAVLIGDKGMTASAEGLHVCDLGEAWRDLTGLPFVWAGWIGDERLTPELVGWLQQAQEFAHQDPESVIELARERSGWPREMVVAYLTKTMSYRLTPEMKAGMAEFGRRLIELGMEPHISTPQWVSGLATVS